MPQLFRLLIVSACAVASALFAASAEAKRIAFVVGNADYNSLSPLRNPQRDAAAVADRLKDLGFQVTELFNADAFSLRRAASSFVAKAGGTDLALFYFAGHGVQLFDRNVLLARDADPKTAKRVQDLGLDLTSFMTALRSSGAVRLALLIDACRDNPLSFEDTVRLLDRLRADPTFKSASTTAGRGTRGLTTVDLGGRGEKSAAQTLLFFAAQPGAVSFDGAGLNSYLVEGLKEQLARPERGFKQMLEGVIGYVRTVTGNRQVPQLVSDWAAELPMGAATSAARIELAVYGKEAGKRILAPAERDLVLRAVGAHSSFRGDFIAKASIGDDLTYGLDEDTKRAARLGTVSAFSLSYDLDRDGREETIHVYPGQVGLVIALETGGVKTVVGGGGETLEIALKDINGDRKPEIWIVDADDEGKSRMWGKLSILEYTGLPNLADLRRGNTGLFHDGYKAFRTLLRADAGWGVSVATDQSIKVCAGSNCHTVWSYAFDGERFRLLMDGSMEPTTARALPFRDMKERSTRMMSHLLKSTAPLVPYGWRVAQPKAGSATVTASVGAGTEIVFACGTGYPEAYPAMATSLIVRGGEAVLDGIMADQPALIDGKACEAYGGPDAKAGTIRFFLGKTEATDSCWTRLTKASLVTFPVEFSQGKALLQLRMTEAGRYLTATQRACSGDRGALGKVPVSPPVSFDPSPPPIQTQDIRTRIARFISEQYFQYSAAAETRQILASSVDYYGKQRTRNEVVRDKLRYYAKWPNRTYTLMPATLSVSPTPGQPGRWYAEFQYTFRVSGLKGVRSGRGVARLGLVPASGSGFLIASESGEVLERY